MSLANEVLGDEDRVLVVVAVPGHEGDEHVLAERQLALVGRGAVGDDLARLDLVALVDDRGLVQAGPLVQADELAERILLVADDDAAWRRRRSTVPAFSA